MKNNIYKKVIGVLMFVCLFTSSFVFAEENENPTPELPKVTIHLDIESDTQTVFNNDIEVTACDSDNNGTMTLSAYCAVLQSGVNNDWSWWGSDAFLNSLGGFTNNDNNNGVYWGWFANLELGQTGLNKYILNSGDSILISYNINPLRVISDNSNPVVGEPFNFTVQSFGYDSSWNPAWVPVLDANVNIGNDNFQTDADGKVNYTASTEGNISIKATKSGFVDSKELNLSVATSSDNSNNNGGGGGPQITKNNLDVSAAVSFLSQNQKQDGSFGDMLYTDWVAIALGSVGNKSNAGYISLVNYLKNTKYTPSSVTDSERHAMALMAVGLNPYTALNVDYISNIVTSFDGVQFGDSSLDNDDIFALIALYGAGYNDSDSIIVSDISTLLSHQLSNGSLGSVDMTAAFIQALRPFANIVGVNSAISKAENYLITQQDSFGSFGNSFATGWSLQALSQNNSFTTQNTKADLYLANKQAVDGGVDDISNTNDNRVWATAYSIPGALHKEWSSILVPVTKPVISFTGGPQVPSPTVVPVSVDENKEIKKETELVTLDDSKKEDIKDISKVKDKEVKKLKKNKKILLSKLELENKNINLTENINLSASAADSIDGVSSKGKISKAMSKMGNWIKAIISHIKLW